MINKGNSPVKYRTVLRQLQKHYGAIDWRPKMGILDELIFTVLTQHTSDLNAEKAFKKLKSVYPNWTDVVETGNKELEATIKHGGLANQKALRIKSILFEIHARLSNFNLDVLKDMGIEDVREWLISLPGVGPKTAAVVMSFALDLPAFPVDTHVHRVSRRLGFITSKTTADNAHPIMEKLIAPTDRFKFHILLINHGRRTCKARNPLCDKCPIVTNCPSAYQE
ncbi:MAG: endonuclease III [SAR202 cluster bacterium]|nr:DNA lyase [Chloroflexota bacterium]MDP7231664.1 endonuclease III [Dehalococcoidia bacterium]MDP7613522.1 endonuclease III [Dehalococcoidia bacterium]MQG47745.1 endonuclease III [SAR202 cluster bacterium]